MKEDMEQFHNPASSFEAAEKSKSAPAEIQPSPEKGTFAGAVEQIKTSDRAVKLLNLVEAGYSPSPEELRSIDLERLVGRLRQKYPTTEDIQMDLLKAVNEQIGVAPQSGWTQEQYAQAIREKQEQYKKEAVQTIVSALTPVYEKFGALPSEENKRRILENLSRVAEEIAGLGKEFGDYSSPVAASKANKKFEYAKKNILAAVNQKLNPEEARAILQMQQAFFEEFNRFSAQPHQDIEIESALQRIKENSGLRLEELQEQLGVPKKETPSEKFELKGAKREIEYPGIPVDVYLADKRLQIIDVRNDPRWNADYLLIDPAKFDQMNPRTGYKGIRENEPVTLGRDNPLRFELPDTVSRTHLKIELRGGKLTIEDLGSTNGTILQLEKPRKPSKEQIEAQEAGPERERAIAEFREYVKKHQSEIENQLQQGRDLDELFYHDFYNSNIDNPKYRENDPVVQNLIKEYSSQVNAVRENLLRESQAGQGPAPMDNGYWLYVNTNGGFRNRSALGRIYFNLKPEHVGQFFYKTAKAFYDAGLHSQMKIPMIGNAEAFNRLDKMVVYFDEEEEQKVLQILENLYRSNPEAFDETGTPRFTAEIKNQRGEKMAGIGFAEEPPFRNESFGSIRAKILADVYIEARNLRRSISDRNFDFEAAFRRACLKYQVDPQNPAFNLQRGSEKFTELKKRIQERT